MSAAGVSYVYFTFHQKWNRFSSYRYFSQGSKRYLQGCRQCLVTTAKYMVYRMFVRIERLQQNVFHTGSLVNRFFY
jgi:hypothetical protein